MEKSIWGRCDGRLGLPVGLGDHDLLDNRHAGEGRLDAQIAAGDHHPVGFGEDLIEVVQRRPGLDLGDDRRVAPEPGQLALRRPDVLGRPNK
jgi:hypothetical protein